MTAFAEAGNRDLASFHEQWLTRTGAPVLTLDEVDFREDEVVFTLGQDDLVGVVRTRAFISQELTPIICCF